MVDTHLHNLLIFCFSAADLKKVDGEEAGEKRVGDYFGLKVKICNGKVIHVIASVKGFFAVGKQLTHCHSIVDLLQNVSNAFAKVISMFWFSVSS